jgi:hypothetical protein
MTHTCKDGKQHEGDAKDCPNHCYQVVEFNRNGVGFVMSIFQKSSNPKDSIGVLIRKGEARKSERSEE